MPNAAISSILNLFGIGLGYVYLGHMRKAFVFFAAFLCLVAIAGWLGLIFDPVGIYAIAVLALLIGLAPFAHCPVLAKSGKAAERRYRVWWVYLIWILASWIISQALLDARPAAFGYNSFRLPSQSMSPTLRLGDYVTADTWSQRTGMPKHGEIYVFELNDGYGTKYLKRIVGLPGETIEIRSNKLVRDGQIITEDYPATDDPVRDFGPVVLGDGEYFVLGDNRARSKDSRYIGPISQDQLHGLVKLRWLAIDGGVVWDRFPFVFE